MDVLASLAALGSGGLKDELPEPAAPAVNGKRRAADRMDAGAAAALAAAAAAMEAAAPSSAGPHDGTAASMTGVADAATLLRLLTQLREGQTLSVSPLPLITSSAADSAAGAPPAKRPRRAAARGALAVLQAEHTGVLPPAEAAELGGRLFQYAVTSALLGAAPAAGMAAAAGETIQLAQQGGSGLAAAWLPTASQQPIQPPRQQPLEQAGPAAAGGLPPLPPPAQHAQQQLQQQASSVQHPAKPAPPPPEQPAEQQQQQQQPEQQQEEPQQQAPQPPSALSDEGLAAAVAAAAVQAALARESSPTAADEQLPSPRPRQDASMVSLGSPVIAVFACVPSLRAILPCWMSSALHAPPCMHHPARFSPSHPVPPRLQASEPPGGAEGSSHSGSEDETEDVDGEGSGEEDEEPTYSDVELLEDFMQHPAAGAPALPSLAAFGLQPDIAAAFGVGPAVAAGAGALRSSGRGGRSAASRAGGASSKAHRNSVHRKGGMPPLCPGCGAPPLSEEDKRAASKRGRRKKGDESGACVRGCVFQGLGGECNARPAAPVQGYAYHHACWSCAVPFHLSLPIQANARTQTRCVGLPTTRSFPRLVCLAPSRRRPAQPQGGADPRVFGGAPAERAPVAARHLLLPWPLCHHRLPRGQVSNEAEAGLLACTPYIRLVWSALPRAYRGLHAAPCAMQLIASLRVSEGARRWLLP